MLPWGKHAKDLRPVILSASKLLYHYCCHQQRNELDQDDDYSFQQVEKTNFRSLTELSLSIKAKLGGFSPLEISKSCHIIKTSTVKTQTKTCKNETENIDIEWIWIEVQIFAHKISLDILIFWKRKFRFIWWSDRISVDVKLPDWIPHNFQNFPQHLMYAQRLSKSSLKK